MSNWNSVLEANRARYESELFDLLRIPSISAQPDHDADVLRAGQWVADRFTAAGMESVAIMPAGRHVCVYADWLHAPGKPTILIYDHFDVQPPDPLDLWTTPPFEPQRRDGRVYARGSTDSKGNVMIVIAALEAWLRADGALPLNVKILFEGQEEIGSPNLGPFVAAQRDRLACDLVVCADGGQWSEDRPELCLGTRGLCAVQVDVTAASHDLHSGIYGGAVPNPIHAIAAIIHSLHGPDGRVLVDGFYDAVTPLTTAERAELAAIPFEEHAYLEETGAAALIGEAGYSTYERAWARPTLEVNGIWGGYQGDGVKTVLPAQAHAKITCRLVPDQDPAAVRGLVAAHILRSAPASVRVEMSPLGGGAYPYLMPADHWGNRAAATVLHAVYGREPYRVRSGGTLPILDMFLKRLGAYSVNFGFGLEDEKAHSPNEFLRLASFHRGMTAYCLLFEELARGVNRSATEFMQ